MSQLTTHVLDLSTGVAAADIPVTLRYREPNGEWILIAEANTNVDGRAPDLVQPELSLVPGTYRLTYEIADYYQRQQRPAFFPQIDLTFDLEGSTHYHLPVYLSPFGFSTCRDG